MSEQIDTEKNEEFWNNFKKKRCSSESELSDLLCVGNYEIRKYGDLIFISHSSGESGGFDPVLFEKCIDKFFNDNF